VWLSPGPDASTAPDRLVAAGFSKVVWTRYPTLVARDLAERQVASDLTIREVNSEDVRQARDALGESLPTDYVATAGQPGFHHFMAFDGSGPVATAALALFEGVGYLAFASTEPGSRGRGAQQALIARRMKEARRLGCDLLVSETLTMLPHSMANLQRLGFVEAHEKLVYAWGA
jgi:GNAT superfamily N-acetyltransferase